MFLISATRISSEDEVTRAEIIWALKCAQTNFAFNSNDGMADTFQIIFADSKIAAAYSMGATKTKYVTQFGIATYIKDELIADLFGAPFTFKFDETTTSQVKKQYDGYVQFYSRKHNRIINHYAGSLLLGHCTADNLKTHFFEFMASLKCNINSLIHIGMDGPNVNLAFQRSLEKELLELHGKRILNILHPVHTAFAKGLKMLNFDFNQFPSDLHFFFKYSSARRQDYAFSEIET